jgi:hypothetical protein
MVHIEKAGISQCALNQIKRLAAFRNPEFYKAQAMRLPTYDKPRVIDCSAEDSLYLSIPRGCLPSLVSLLSEAGAVYLIEDKTTAGALIEVTFNGELMNEQMQAADALMANDIGVLSAATAFGKTVVAADIIAEKRINTWCLYIPVRSYCNGRNRLNVFSLSMRRSQQASPKDAVVGRSKGMSVNWAPATIRLRAG